MTLDNIVNLCVFGGLFVLNAISLILVYTTKYGKEYLETLRKNESKGYFIFWHFWMMLVGIMFWPAVGIEKFVDWIKRKKER